MNGEKKEEEKNSGQRTQAARTKISFIASALKDLAFWLKLHHPGGGRGQVTLISSISSSWVKITLHTKNQLSRLPGSALTVGGRGGVGGGGPTNYFVSPNLS